jgi:hypothetical protein
LVERTPNSDIGNIRHRLEWPISGKPDTGWMWRPLVWFATTLSGGRPQGSPVGTRTGRGKPTLRAEDQPRTGNGRGGEERKSPQGPVRLPFRSASAGSQKSPRRALGRAPNIGLPDWHSTERPPPLRPWPRGTKRGDEEKEIKPRGGCARENEESCPSPGFPGPRAAKPRRVIRDPTLESWRTAPCSSPWTPAFAGEAEDRKVRQLKEPGTPDNLDQP